MAVEFPKVRVYNLLTKTKPCIYDPEALCIVISLYQLDESAVK